MSQTEFKYESITDRATRRKVESQTKEIRGLLERTGQAVVEIGRRMQEVHELLPLPLFVAWVDCEFGWSRPQAVNYMQAARVFGGCDCLKQFQPAGLVALARRNVPEAVITAAIERARGGEQITHKLARTLLAEAGVEPNNKSAGVARKPHTAAAAVAKASLAEDPVTALRETLTTFVTNIDRLSESLSVDDRNELADQFMQLALQIRQTPEPAPNPSRKSGRKLAVVS